MSKPIKFTVDRISTGVSSGIIIVFFLFKFRIKENVKQQVLLLRQKIHSKQE